MLSFPHVEVLLVGVGGLGATCAVTLRLAAVDSDRVFLLPATLLAIAAFVPAAVVIWGGGRETLGADDAELNRILIAVYLLGVFTTLLVAPTVARSNDVRILWIVVLYWVTGAVSNLNAGLPTGRLSFLIVPLIFIVAWRYRPSYRDALSLLGLVSLAVCGASLLLAIYDPSSAFIGPARVSDILGPHRLAGIFEHPNGLGLFAAIGVIVWWRREGWLRMFGVSVCGLVLVASDSRTAWFACAAAVIVLLAGKWYKARPFSPGRLILGASLLALAASLIFIFGARDELGHITFNGRTAVWRFVGDRWDESPILGHGPAVWSSLISEKQVPDWWGEAHNQFFQSLYTTGLIGVGLLLLLVWYWTVANLRFARDGYLLPLALEALLAVIGLFESPLSLGGVAGNVWLLSILLFLRPAGTQLASASATLVDQGDASQPRPPFEVGSRVEGAG